MNEDFFYMAFNVCDTINNHEAPGNKFAEWEVAYHTSQLAWRQSLYDNGEFKLLAEFIDLAIERIELNNR